MNVLILFAGFVAGFLAATLWWLTLEIVHEIPGVFHYLIWNSDKAEKVRRFK